MHFKSDFGPAGQRPYLWSFAGVLKASRFEMVKALREVGPNYIHAIPTKDQRIAKARYLELLEHSTFAPCPMGNVIMESHRLYESLEAGCIPILERRSFVHYHERLLRDPPLIFVRSWREARQKMLALAEDHTKLDLLQRKMYEWWLDFKKDLKTRVTALADMGFSQRGTPGVRVRPVAVIPGWHYAEMLRHQSATALLWRVQRNLLHGRLKTPF
jgi:Exostosin family